MSAETTCPQRCRLPPALMTDLPVLVVLVGGWALVALPWAHLTAGLGLVVLVLVHLATRRRLPARLLRRPTHRLATLASAWAVLAAMAGVTATGLLRWAGVPREDAWHGGAGYLLLTAVAWHLWLVRHPLRARTKPDVALPGSKPGNGAE